MFSHPDRIVRGLRRSRFVVTMKSGETWRGVLMHADEHTLELMRATSVTAGPDGVVETPVDGRLFLPRSDVDYIQQP